MIDLLPVLLVALPPYCSVQQQQDGSGQHRDGTPCNDARKPPCPGSVAGPKQQCGELAETAYVPQEAEYSRSSSVIRLPSVLLCSPGEHGQQHEQNRADREPEHLNRQIIAAHCLPRSITQ